MFSLINIISTLLISTTCLHAMINFEDLYDHSKKKSKNEEKVISRKCPSLNQNLALQAVQGINTQLTINNDLWVVSSLLIQEQTGLTGYPIMVPVFSNITPISSNWTTKLNTFINNNSFQKTKDAGSYNQEGTVCRYAYSYMNNERFFDNILHIDIQYVGSGSGHVQNPNFEKNMKEFSKEKKIKGDIGFKFN